MRNFGTYFTGTYVCLLVPRESACCMTPLGTDQRFNTLLSMDIAVETFFEIGMSDLLVLTQSLQDQLYMEV